MMTIPETTDLSDFEFARPCMPNNIACDCDAEWLIIAKCCGLEQPRCTEHKELVIANVLDLLGKHAYLECNECGVELVGSKISDFWSIEPL